MTILTKLRDFSLYHQERGNTSWYNEDRHNISESFDLLIHSAARQEISPASVVVGCRARSFPQYTAFLYPVLSVDFVKSIIR